MLASKTPLQHRIELLQGTLDLLVLGTLRWGPQHGHGIGLAIRARSEGALQVETGSLYPALHRLERQGWIASTWKTTSRNQRAKYYRLTRTGRQQLLRKHSSWEQLVKAMAAVMTPSPETS